MLEKVQVILSGKAILPTRAHDTDAGYDLYTPYSAFVAPQSSSSIDIGVRVNIPAGYYGQIVSKSGLMKNSRITVRGVIDSGYQGSIQVILFNHSNKVVMFDAGDKIAQMIFLKCESPKLEIVSEFPEATDRGEGGFGSTGKN